jgi:hypothetical protein
MLRSKLFFRILSSMGVPYVNEQAGTFDSQKGLCKKKLLSKVAHILQNVFHVNTN